MVIGIDIVAFDFERKSLAPIFYAMATGMLIDGIAASEAIDSSGEILSVEGCDISTLATEGVLNWEHRGDDSPGHHPGDIVGKIVYAHKVFEAKDCENDRQLDYWKKIELPFIYIIARLHDGAGSDSAKELAAKIRDYQANGEPILVRYSIEGTTLKTSADKKNLLESVARRVAATIKPCNRSCYSGILSDPNAPEGFEKEPSKGTKDILDEVLKRSEGIYHPNFTPLGGSRDVECNPILPDELLKSEPPDDGPPEDESKYVPMKDWNESLRSQYVKDGKVVASSRTTPFVGKVPPVGTWGMDPMSLNYGREISQLREVDPAKLEPSEHTPERQPDVERYADWMKAGKQAPPIDVVETDRGGLRITDGHRRWRAAQQAGQKLLAWVAPMTAHPEGKVDSEGRPMRVGLTYELAHGKPYKKAESKSCTCGDCRSNGCDPECKHCIPDGDEAPPKPPHLKLVHVQKNDEDPALAAMKVAKPFQIGQKVRTIAGGEARAIATVRQINNTGYPSALIEWTSKPTKPRERPKQKLQWFPHAHLEEYVEPPAAPAPVPAPAPIKKTLTAGSYNAAPSTLTGGAALQVEDISRRATIARAKAALRDWDGMEKFSKFLKHRVPEASDEFIDRFSKLVDEYQFRKRELLMSKSEGVAALVRKFEAMSIDLKKAADMAGVKIRKPKPALPQVPSEISFNGHRVSPGFAKVHNGSSHEGTPYVLLHGDDDHYIGVPHEQFGSHSAEDLVKLPRNNYTAMVVQKDPELLDASPVVDGEKHGAPELNIHPDQKKMIHGLDFSEQPKKNQGPELPYEPYAKDRSHWRKGPKGMVFVKAAEGAVSDFNGARREVAFANLGKDFFGLGDYLPDVALLKHPMTGREHAVVGKIKNGEHPTVPPEESSRQADVHPADEHHRFTLRRLGDSGELDKLAVMDTVLANDDRHHFNYMFTPEGKGLKLIDHELAFSANHGFTPQTPDYMMHYANTHAKDTGTQEAHTRAMHPDAAKWLHSLDPGKLAQSMLKMGVPERFVREAVYRLRKIQQNHQQTPNSRLKMILAGIKNADPINSYE